MLFYKNFFIQTFSHFPSFHQLSLSFFYLFYSNGKQTSSSVMIYNSIVCLFFLFATLYQSRQYLTMKADSQLEASETATGASSTYTLNLIVCLESFAAALAAAIFWNCLCVCARLMTSVADSIMNGYQSEYSFSFSSNSKKLLPETPVIAMQVYFCKKMIFLKFSTFPWVDIDRKKKKRRFCVCRAKRQTP